MRCFWDVYVGKVMEYDFFLDDIEVDYNKSYFGKFVYDVILYELFWKNEYFVVKEV